jgi:hypothetical protein
VMSSEDVQEGGQLGQLCREEEETEQVGQMLPGTANRNEMQEGGWKNTEQNRAEIADDGGIKLRGPAATDRTRLWGECAVRVCARSG